MVYLLQVVIDYHGELISNDVIPALKDEIAIVLDKLTLYFAL
jgi:hypothetical protein